jgi:L-asparaginase
MSNTPSAIPSITPSTRIHIITTGGTIEKTYDETEGSLENRGTVLTQWLARYLRLPYTAIEMHPLMSKDSLHMDEKDRELMVHTIKRILHAPTTEKTAVIVSHGTDTMCLSAEYCLNQLGPLHMPIIFTGAMRPLGLLDSDALQNITEALMCAKLLGPGVYIVFHNEVFQAGKVRKDPPSKTFAAI